MYNKTRLVLAFLLIFTVNVWGQEPSSSAEIPTTEKISIFTIFHNLGWNALDMVTYNYGANFIGAGLGTVVFVKSGLDWAINRYAYHHPAFANSGIFTMYLGYAVPVVMPLAFLTSGMLGNDTRMTLTGMAMGQAALLAGVTQSVLKMITGRPDPGIVNERYHRRNDSTVDFSGEFNWFTPEFVVGWPSGHTAYAVAYAAVISEMYKDHLPAKIGAYLWATLVGVGVGINVHWASEVFAGALIGYAIGKTVGKNFSQLAGKKYEEEKVSLLVNPVFAGVHIKLP
ncbi:MAG: phosphatase PAP2 family protein [Spirochaetaceae bacterium]|jgi:membrane-associated phospholipid phosphatase|nr:phosphatase PAP2 family protein [Spirochaetaceae bacterium]